MPGALRRHIRRRAPLPASDIAAPDGIFITELEAGAGVRLAVKDLFDTAGIRTTYGSAVFADHVPSETAPAVARLEAAGYTDVGKVNLHEFAYGTTSQNVHYGTVPNPRFPGRTTGGSSGGSAAAVAAGLADAALGTDTGGSIRIPSACCGTVGFKPSYGLVPTEGIFPLAPSFDHAGPMANDVAGCVAMMQALVPGFSAVETELEPLRLGVAWTAESDPLIRARVEEAAASFRQRRPVDLPFAPEVQPLFMREIADVHRDLYAENSDLYGENVRPKFERCLTVSEADAAEAIAARAAYRETMEALFAPFDLLLTPTMPLVAPPDDVDEIAIRERMTRFTFPFNALGWPVLALPCGTAEEGLPASLQLIGRPGEDERVLAAGLALERALSAGL